MMVQVTLAAIVAYMIWFILFGLDATGLLLLVVALLGYGMAAILGRSQPS